MSKIKVLNIDKVATSTALKALTGVADRTVKMLGDEIYVYYDKAIKGEHKSDVDDGYWSKNINEGWRILEIVDDLYDFVANSATDVSSISNWGRFGYQLGVDSTTLLDEMNAMVSNWATELQADKNLILLTISTLSNPRATLEQISDLVDIQEGFRIYDTTTDATKTWDGGAWRTDVDLSVITKNITQLNNRIVGGSDSNTGNQEFLVPMDGIGLEVGDEVEIYDIKFRGNFSAANKNVKMAVNSTGGETTDIGRFNAQDSSFWMPDVRGKREWGDNMSANIVDIGGGSIGIKLYFSPTSSLTFSPSGMPNSYTWQIKMSFKVK